MKIRLVKQNQQNASNQEAPKPASKSDLIVKAQSWVNEFKERKATNQAALLQLVKQS